MKKIILALSLLAVLGTANAQWHHHHRPYYGPTVIYRDSNWVAPLILGGIAGAVIANSRQPETVVVQQPPVVVQQPVYVQRQPVCTEWKEIQQPDGTIYRERSCYGPQPIANQ
jgi:hypothetical protein